MIKCNIYVKDLLDEKLPQHSIQNFSFDYIVHNVRSPSVISKMLHGSGLISFALISLMESIFITNLFPHTLPFSLGPCHTYSKKPHRHVISTCSSTYFYQKNPTSSVFIFWAILSCKHIIDCQLYVI